MAIVVRCSCGTKLRVQDSMIGHDVQCGSCQRMIRVPDPARRKQAQQTQQPHQPQYQPPPQQYAPPPQQYAPPPQQYAPPPAAASGVSGWVVALCLVVSLGAAGGAWYMSDLRIREVDERVRVADGRLRELGVGQAGTVEDLKAEQAARLVITQKADEEQKRAGDAERKLWEELIAHSKEHDVLDSDFRVAAAKADELRVRIAAAEAGDKMQQDEARRLKDELRSQLTVQDGLRSELAKTATRLEDVDKQYKVAVQANESLIEKNRKDHEKDLARMQADLSRAQGLVTSLQGQISSASGPKLADLQAQLDRASQRVTALKTYVDDENAWTDRMADLESKRQDQALAALRGSIGSDPRHVNTGGTVVLPGSPNNQVGLRIDSATGDTWATADRFLVRTRQIQESSLSKDKAQRGTQTGRYQVRLLRFMDSATAQPSVEAIRFDTQTGDVWFCDPSVASPKWKREAFVKLQRDTTSQDWRLAVITPKTFGKAYVMVTSTRDGRTYSDFLRPRLGLLKTN